MAERLRPPTKHDQPQENPGRGPDIEPTEFERDIGQPQEANDQQELGLNVVRQAPGNDRGDAHHQRWREEEEAGLKGGIVVDTLQHDRQQKVGAAKFHGVQEPNQAPHRKREIFVEADARQRAVWSSARRR